MSDLLPAFGVCRRQLRVANDNTGLLLQRLIQHCLARRDAVRRQALAFATAGQPRLQFAIGVHLHQQTAICLGNSDGVIEHGAEH